MPHDGTLVMEDPEANGGGEDSDHGLERPKGSRARKAGAGGRPKQGEGVAGGEGAAPQEAGGDACEGGELRAFMESEFYRSGAWKKPASPEEGEEEPRPPPEPKVKARAPARKRVARKKDPDSLVREDVERAHAAHDFYSLYHIV